MLRYFWPSDDEQLAGQWQDSHFDEDAGWWVSVQQSGAVVALAAALAIGASSAAAAQASFSQAQDDPAGSLTSQPLVFEEYWQNPVQPFNWPQPSIFIDDDVHPTYVAAFSPDESDFFLYSPPYPWANLVPLPFLDPEQNPQFTAASPVFDDASNWQPQLPPYDANWTLLFFLDDGSAVPVFQYDEDFWQNPVTPQNWPQPNQPFQASDEDSFVQLFSGNDEGFWASGVAPDPGSLLWVQQWTFEQNEALGELQANPQDTDYWQQLVPPVADSLWILRQDAFEQNEVATNLFSIPQEEYWQNGVVPLVWPQPSVLVFDETIQTFVESFQPDEDFWLQLVPAQPILSNNFQSTFPFWLPLSMDELDGGLIPPPPPPPPPFCPLPPTGPDPNVNISVFGGRSNPTKALFCRICNSPNPLIVRGDFAIWCQDCCAFVSKQDTYMGTVRAPGQFRDVF